jgi:hypothetical protein
MLTGPQMRFVEGIVEGKSATDAYADAFPHSGRDSARASAARLMKEPDIKEEIRRMRSEAEKIAGSAVLTLAQVHSFLYRIVTCRIADLPEDSDLFVSIKRHCVRGEEGAEIVEYKIPDKLGAIAKWMDLKGEGATAKADDGLTRLLASIRK